MTAFLVQTRVIVFEVAGRLVQFGVPLQIGILPISTIRFVFNGKITVETGIDGLWIAPRDGVITRVTICRRTAGNSGATTVDVNNNGVTIFTDQAKRPSVLASDGDNAFDVATDADLPRFVQNDLIEVDVDAAEVGNPMDLSVIFEIAFDA